MFTERRKRVALGIAVVTTLAGLALAQTASGPANRAYVPSGHGWFCFEDPLPRGGTTQTCERPQRACERLRNQRRAQGESTGGCMPSPSAYCVTYMDYMERRPTARHVCQRELAQCNAMRAQLAASNQEQDVYRSLSVCTPYQ